MCVCVYIDDTDIDIDGKIFIDRPLYIRIDPLTSSSSSLRRRWTQVRHIVTRVNPRYELYLD